MEGSTFVYSCILPFFYISKILGLFPVTFDGKEFKCNKNIIIYSFVFNIIHQIINIVIFTVTNREMFFKTIETAKFINFIGEIISQACLILNYIYIYYAIINLPKILNLLSITSKVLNIGHYRFILWKFVVISCVFHTSSAVSVYFFDTINVTTDGLQNVLLGMVSRLGITGRLLSETVLEIQFCTFCSIIRYLFQAINLELFNYVKSRRVNDHRIKELQECYTNLVHVSIYINDLYGVSNLLHMVMLNVFIHTDIYELVQYVYDKVTQKQQHTFHVRIIPWTLTDVFKCMFYFMESCNVVAEVSNMCIIILLFLF